jgi:hypothetical protein
MDLQNIGEITKFPQEERVGAKSLLNEERLPRNVYWFRKGSRMEISRK